MIQKVSKTKRLQWLSALVLGMVVLFALGGVYLLTLIGAPVIASFTMKPIEIATLPAPSIRENKIIIPKIAVTVPYSAEGEAALDRGAWWRHDERGNPKDGGNFIIAAHRFTLMSTFQETVTRSPFYNIDKLAEGDEVLVDYEGRRYTYEINKTFTVKPSQVEIEAPSATPKLTIYTCSLGGASDGRVVLTATPKTPFEAEVH